MLNFVLLDNYFSELLTEVQIWYRTALKLGPGRIFRKKNAEKSLFSTIGAVNKDIKSKRKMYRQ